MKYLEHYFEEGFLLADTLLLSALFFPKKPHHNISKDYKLRAFEKNDPLIDSQNARTLFYKVVEAFNALDDDLQSILFLLLMDHKGCQGFFEYIGFNADGKAEDIIKKRFEQTICRGSDLTGPIEQNPFELACVLVMVAEDDRPVTFPPWILRNYPKVDDILKALRNTPCGDNACLYCTETFNVRNKLKRYFGFDEFRTFEGKPLQEQSVTYAVQGKSFITVFPTGGGKSLTFQLPALIAGEAENALTVVISPLVALMKDQVDNLEKKWKIDAVMINGLLDPVSRQEAIERVRECTANILYISPEALRNNTICDLIRNRVIARFVIDEAHCFSSWGQDFRVDYVYIGKFIRQLQEEKQLDYQIPVSCFTATAGQKVLEDISSYFQHTLGLGMDRILASPERKNLTYGARDVSGVDKYSEIRDLIEIYDCPTIVYVFRVIDTYRIAARLTEDGINARPFNGKMSSTQKAECMEAFLNNEVDVMVATSAFGMGVDKDNIGLVIHHQIPASLEDYLQEAGRAGRDEKVHGNCIALFDNADVDFNFFVLNQTKLSFKDIQNVWAAIKYISFRRPVICVSTEELAEAAGWTSSDSDVSATEIKTAVGALENAGYVIRENNVNRIYSTGIIPDNMEEARAMIDRSVIITEDDRLHAIRIMEVLFTSDRVGKVQGEDSKRTDEIAEVLALPHQTVLRLIELLREDRVLADSQDMTAGFRPEDTEKKSSSKLERALKLEDFLIQRVFHWEDETIDYKVINEKAKEMNMDYVTPGLIRAILMHWAIRGYITIKRIHSNRIIDIHYLEEKKKVAEDYMKRRELCQFIIQYLYDLRGEDAKEDSRQVQFSLLMLKEAYEHQLIIHEGELHTSQGKLRDALMYIQRIDAMMLEGGFFVLSQRMKIRRIEMNNRIKYKKDDYKNLENHYRQKSRQIHIMAAYTKILRYDPSKAKGLVNDYFSLEPKVFDQKYFSKDQIKAMEKNISPEQYERLFGQLTDIQKEIINDQESQYICVAAGPGSGKTMVLVHKLASLVLMEDVKCEQLLMLTFSRLAASEFKRRLIDLIGPAAYNVEIKTFHSYCFDILGRKGSLDESVNIEKEAVQMIRDNEIERERINKAVLVIDEAQDMSWDENELINILISTNEDMRVILVGDDDQNIYEFRGSSSKYMKRFIEVHDAARYSMIQNHRSDRSIVRFANLLAEEITERLKSEPGIPISDSNGSVVLAKYRSGNLEIPVLEMVRWNKTFDNTCILTRTNEEASLITGALLEAGINARLIQNNDGFRLMDLVEIRRFYGILEEGSQTPEIMHDLWSYAKDTICEEYSRSTVLETCLRIIDGFETVNEKKYKTDLVDFLTESQFGDYERGSENKILVSTIHKAKGREFSNVYLVLNNCVIRTDEVRRLLYVGCTRAKNNLYVLYNSLGK